MDDVRINFNYIIHLLNIISFFIAKGSEIPIQKMFTNLFNIVYITCRVVTFAIKFSDKRSSRLSDHQTLIPLFAFYACLVAIIKFLLINYNNPYKELGCRALSFYSLILYKYK